MSTTAGATPATAFITFVHVEDLGRSDVFYRRVLGLPLVTEQEVCRIYRVAPSAYLGLCTHRPPTPPDSVILTLVRDDVEAFCRTLVARGAQLEHGPEHSDRFAITHAFLRDPDGHLIEVQRFDDPGWSDLIEEDGHQPIREVDRRSARDDVHQDSITGSERSGPVDLGLPIETDRLILRSARFDDADGIRARRSRPSDGRVPMAGPTPGEWRMVIIDLAEPDAAGRAAHGGGAAGEGNIGDVAVHLDESGTRAEIGYNLNPERQGRGFATEAVSAVLDRLFAVNHNLVGVQARMRPDNPASAAVAERCGMVFEGQTRRSSVPRTTAADHGDDRHYGLLRDEWETWRSRPTGPPASVDLVEVTADNVRPLCELVTHKSQDHLVAPVAHSLADALVPPTREDGDPVVPWYRAVEADGEFVGFVMMALPSANHPETYLWRMLIDRRHQRRGIGRRVLALLVDQAKAWGSEELQVSWVPGPGSPEGFYRGYGFEPTGPADQSGEVPGRLLLRVR